MLDGDKQARLAQITCSEPPPGRARWTLQLLIECLVELEVFGANRRKYAAGLVAKSTGRSSSQS
jgi:hypothetical protein